MIVGRLQETWNSRVGVILAVSGSAVGLGNFLRFPGQAAQYGGGAFMVAYFIALLLLGLPICWAEWTMGRKAGSKGFHSCPGILHLIVRHRHAKYLGVIGVIIPLIIYMYYVVIEAWCLGYAVSFLTGGGAFETPESVGAFFATFTGVGGDGSALGLGINQVGIFLTIVFVLNFVLVYRGISQGIELFCKFAMPTLVVLALVILVRVLTLGTPDAATPENNVSNGLGFMWNPTKVFVVSEEAGEIVETEIVGAAEIAAATDAGRTLREVSMWEQLRKPQLWLAAAGQIFFSLSVGFGIILTYASYLKPDDDVVLSGLAATSANEFCEVGLGGLITLPAGVAFLGLAGVAGQGTFGLGFNVLPLVFAEMPFGWLFGFLFFFLLFLAAVTSSISMLQPGIAFLEEALQIGRRASVAILGLITAVGCGFVVYFSGDLKALDTLDFWAGTFLIFILATIQIIVFGWSMGVEAGFKEAHRGSVVRIPSVFKPVIRWICPAFLITIFTLWLVVNVFGISLNGGGQEFSGYIVDLFIEPNLVAQLSVGLIILLGIFITLVIASSPAYTDSSKEKQP